MMFALVGAMSVAAATAARPLPPDEPLTAGRYGSVVDAIQAILVDDPAVVAFGELHQTRATAAIPSALRRFTELILPAIADRVSHLVIETWVTTGRCGEVERAVTAEVEKTTDRPAGTQSEIEILIQAAIATKITPRILSIACSDYAAMRPSGQPVDYDRVLRITARALESSTLVALRDRAASLPSNGASLPSSGRPGSSSLSQSPSARPSFVAVYGGALHNDLHPDPDLAPYSLAPKIMAATLGRYLEVDLVVPEYVAGSSTLLAQPWWKAYRRSSRSSDGPATVVIRRSRRSFVIVLQAHHESP
jgi:hypothetical protein